jgi:hypothetical protein
VSTSRRFLREAGGSARALVGPRRRRLRAYVSDPPSADLAAQAFRAGLFEREGFTLFNTAWYGGHHTPGYSVLFPPLAAALGERVVGALAAVAATAAFGALAGRTAALLVVPSLIASLFSGRLTFVLGAAFGIAATLAAVRGRPWLAALGGVATALASPVAAGFAAVAGAALALQGRAPSPFMRGGAALAAGAVVAALFLVVAFPEGGRSRSRCQRSCRRSPRGSRSRWSLRRDRCGPAGALYAVLCAARSSCPRRWAATPRAWARSWRRRWHSRCCGHTGGSRWRCSRCRSRTGSSSPPSATSGGRRATLRRKRGTTGPLVAFLRERGDARRIRIEIPFTQNHGEARYVAPHVALARGWERQLDRERNALFYDDEPLTPQRYATWLRRNAVAYVAVPLGVRWTRRPRPRSAWPWARPAS